MVNFGFHLAPDHPPFYFLGCFKRLMTPVLVHKRLVLPNPEETRRTPSFLEAWNRNAELPPELFYRTIAARIHRDKTHEVLYGAPLLRNKSRAHTEPLVGYCGVTPFNVGDCTGGQKGSWAELHSMDECVAACRGCPRCNFVSFSLANRDCSWFHRCSMHRLITDEIAAETYLTLRVQPATLG